MAIIQTVSRDSGRMFLVADRGEIDAVSMPMLVMPFNSAEAPDCAPGYTSKVSAQGRFCSLLKC